MKRIAILASLLGATFAAGCTAQVRSEPAYVTTRRPPPEPVVVEHRERDHHRRDHDRGDHRPPPPGPPPIAERGWVTLAENYSAQSGRQFVKPSGQFDKIRVEAVRGAPVVTKIVVEYSPNDVQVVEPNARLTPGEGYQLNLNGRNRSINRIAVYTEPQYGGEYSVFGS